MASKRKRKDTDEDFSLLRGSFTPEQVREIIEKLGTMTTEQVREPTGVRRVPKPKRRTFGGRRDVG